MAYGRGSKGKHWGSFAGGFMEGLMSVLKYDMMLKHYEAYDKYMAAKMAQLSQGDNGRKVLTDAADGNGKDFDDRLRKIREGGGGAAGAGGGGEAPTTYGPAFIDAGGGGSVSMAALKEAVHSQETRGYSLKDSYGALGPEVPGRGRAIGRYQVMPENVKPWTKQVLGKEMSPEEFRASPEAQEKVFEGIMGGYVKERGLIGAQKAWFGPGKSDRFTSQEAYRSGFLQNYQTALKKQEDAASTATADKGAVQPGQKPPPDAKVAKDSTLAPPTKSGNPSDITDVTKLAGFTAIENKKDLMDFMGAHNIKIDPTNLNWCAGLVQAHLANVGIAGPKTSTIPGVGGVGTRPAPDTYGGYDLRASAFSKWGDQVDPGKVQSGDVLVSRDAQTGEGRAAGPTGHVGLATGQTRQGPNGPEIQMVSGNYGGVHGDRGVGYAWVPASQFDIRRGKPGSLSETTPPGQLQSPSMRPAEPPPSPPVQEIQRSIPTTWPTTPPADQPLSPSKRVVSPPPPPRAPRPADTRPAPDAGTPTAEAQPIAPAIPLSAQAAAAPSSPSDAETNRPLPANMASGYGPRKDWGPTPVGPFPPKQPDQAAQPDTTTLASNTPAPSPQTPDDDLIPPPEMGIPMDPSGSMDAMAARRGGPVQRYWKGGAVRRYQGGGDVQDPGGSAMGMPPALAGAQQQVPPIYFNPATYAPAGAPVGKGISAMSAPTMTSGAIPTLPMWRGGVVKGYADGGDIGGDIPDTSFEDMRLMDEDGGGAPRTSAVDEVMKGIGYDDAGTAAPARPGAPAPAPAPATVPAPAPAQPIATQADMSPIPSETRPLSDAETNRPIQLASAGGFHMPSLSRGLPSPRMGGGIRMPGIGLGGGTPKSKMPGVFDTEDPNHPSHPDHPANNPDLPPHTPQIADEDGNPSNGLVKAVSMGLHYFGQLLGIVPGDKGAIAADPNVQATRRGFASGQGGPGIIPISDSDDKKMDEVFDPHQMLTNNLRNIAKLEGVVDKLMETGDMEGASKVAASIMYRSMQVNMKFGRQAVEDFYKNDLQGTIDNLKIAHDAIADGTLINARIVDDPTQPGGKAVEVNGSKLNGEQLWNEVVGPRAVLEAATNAANGSTAWKLYETMAGRHDPNFQEDMRERRQAGAQAAAQKKLDDKAAADKAREDKVKAALGDDSDWGQPYTPESSEPATPKPVEAAPASTEAPATPAPVPEAAPAAPASAEAPAVPALPPAGGSAAAEQPTSGMTASTGATGIPAGPMRVASLNPMSAIAGGASARPEPPAPVTAPPAVSPTETVSTAPTDSTGTTGQPVQPEGKDVAGKPPAPPASPPPPPAKAIPPGPSMGPEAPGQGEAAPADFGRKVNEYKQAQAAARAQAQPTGQPGQPTLTPASQIDVAEAQAADKLDNTYLSAYQQAKDKNVAKYYTKDGGVIYNGRVYKLGDPPAPTGDKDIDTAKRAQYGERLRQLAEMKNINNNLLQKDIAADKDTLDKWFANETNKQRNFWTSQRDAYKSGEADKRQKEGEVLKSQLQQSNDEYKANLTGVGPKPETEMDKDKMGDAHVLIAKAFNPDLKITGSWDSSHAAAVQALGKGGSKVALGTAGKVYDFNANDQDSMASAATETYRHSHITPERAAAAVKSIVAGNHFVFDAETTERKTITNPDGTTETRDVPTMRHGAYRYAVTVEDDAGRHISVLMPYDQLQNLRDIRDNVAKARWDAQQGESRTKWTGEEAKMSPETARTVKDQVADVTLKSADPLGMKQQPPQTTRPRDIDIDPLGMAGPSLTLDSRTALPTRPEPWPTPPPPRSPQTPSEPPTMPPESAAARLRRGYPLPPSEAAPPTAPAPAPAPAPTEAIPAGPTVLRPEDSPVTQSGVRGLNRLLGGVFPKTSGAAPAPPSREQGDVPPETAAGVRVLDRILGSGRDEQTPPRETRWPRSMAGGIPPRPGAPRRNTIESALEERYGPSQ